jgi:hypothetical protein
MIRLIFAALLVAASTPAMAELHLKPVSPDEPVEYTLNHRLSVESALGAANSLKSILNSFRVLTEKSRGKIAARELKKIGNTARDTQDVGFTNLPRTIEGTLLKQDYTIKKLKYELAQEQSKSGRASATQVAAAKTEYEKSEEAFQKFWNGFGISD